MFTSNESRERFLEANVELTNYQSPDLFKKPIDLVSALAGYNKAMLKLGVSVLLGPGARAEIPFLYKEALWAAFCSGNLENAKNIAIHLSTWEPVPEKGIYEKFVAKIDELRKEKKETTIEERSRIYRDIMGSELH